MSVFVYEVDARTEPARDRRAMTFTEIYLGLVTDHEFRKNPRGELGTRTATLHREREFLSCAATGFPRNIRKRTTIWEEAYSRSTAPTSWLN